MRSRYGSWREPLMGALLAGLVALPLLWMAGVRRASEFDRQSASERTTLDSRAGAALDRVTRRLELAAGLLREEVVSEELELDEYYDWAPNRAAEYGLDVLELHMDGMLLSSANWPEQAGLPREAPRSGMDVATIAGAGRARGAIVMGLNSRNERDVSLRLGSFIDASFVDEIVGRRPAAIRIVTGDGSAVFSSRGDPAVDDSSDLLRLDIGKPPALRMEYAAPARPSVWSASESSLVALALVFGAVFGAITARRTHSAVGKLIEAVESVRTGRADYDFSGARDEPWEELAAAFSRLQRSLDTQQRRRAAAERIAAWRDVARRVAHEVKNPLVPIRLTVENLQRARGRDPALFERLFKEGSATILEEVDGLGRLVNEFAEFARMPPMQRTTLEFRNWLAGQIELYRSDPQLDLRVIAGAPLKVSIDSEQFGRVLKNVMSNAIEAMRGSTVRELTIGVREERGIVEMTVDDTGPGFDSETLRRVFEPYFTTREEGTGLGLSIVERIVVEHGGWIDVANRPDRKGARVKIAIPVDGNVE